MLLCGFPFIKVNGTTDDWKLLKEHWLKLKIQSPIWTTTIDKWMNSVNTVIDDILTNFNDQNFWNSIFSLKKCGSGHQTKALGWITNLFVNKPRLEYVKNFSSHVSNIKYNNIQTEQHYEMNVGLFSSTLVDEFMEPEFSSIIFNTTKFVELSKELQKC